MAFVRRRITQAGTVSTALVESYRDENGRPRQRVLANLYGAESTLDALAKLAAQRDMLRKEKDRIDPELEHAAKFYEAVTTKTLNGHRFSAGERKEIDPLMRQRKRFIARADKVNAILGRIEKDGAIIKKYCTASADEIQSAIRDYRKKLQDADVIIVGAEYMFDKAKSEYRRLSV